MKIGNEYWRNIAYDAIIASQSSSLTDICKKFAKIDSRRRNDGKGIPKNVGKFFFSVIFRASDYAQDPLTESERNLPNGGYHEWKLNDNYVLIYKAANKNEQSQATLRQRFSKMPTQGYFEHSF